MSNHPNTDRFLAAFNRIDQHLRDKTGRRDRGRDSFVSVLKFAARSDAAVRSRRSDLRDYAELRNAIVHGYDGRPLAEVLPDTADAIERLGQLIASPPRVDRHMHADVLSCRQTDSTGEVAAQMAARDISQAPVVNDVGAPLGLLSTNTIARWIGACMSTLPLMEDAPVQDVLRYRERDDDWVTVPRDETLPAALERFHHGVSEGRPIEAMLVTQTGRHGERVLGIVTVYDVPELHAAVFD